MDGASSGVPIKATYEPIFRDHLGDHVESFVFNLGIVNALFAELMREILAIEHAYTHGWTNLWLDSDYKLVVIEFIKPYVVP